MLYGTSFVAARYAGIRDFLHAASTDAVHTPPSCHTAGSKPSPSERRLYELPLCCQASRATISDIRIWLSHN